MPTTVQAWPTAAATAEFYGLDGKRAADIIDKIVAVVGTWREVARKAGIANADIELTAAAFSAHTEYAMR